MAFGSRRRLVSLHLVSGPMPTRGAILRDFSGVLQFDDLCYNYCIAYVYLPCDRYCQGEEVGELTSVIPGDNPAINKLKVFFKSINESCSTSSIENGIALGFVSTRCVLGGNVTAAHGANFENLSTFLIKLSCFPEYEVPPSFPQTKGTPRSNQEASINEEKEKARRAAKIEELAMKVAALQRNKGGNKAISGDHL